MPNVLIYGGTFDPVHHGHLIPCRRAREMLEADEVLLVPARISPHKSGLMQATPEQRLAMLRLAVAAEPGFSIDARELSRQGKSYTVDTLRELCRDRPNDRFTLLLGADQLRLFSTWREVDALVAMVDVAVLARPGVDMEAGLEQVRGQLGEAGRKLRGLQTPLVDVSATNIRERVAAGLSIRWLVPGAVEEYISREGLYRTDRAAESGT